MSSLRTPRHSTLSAALAIGLGVSLSLAADAQSLVDATEAPRALRILLLGSAGMPADPHLRESSQTNQRGPHPTSVTHTVDTCADDDSPGSLRAIIGSMNTGDGDTIDLTHLPLNCSTITLNSDPQHQHTPGHITITQPNLHLLGPGSHALTIEATYHYSGVLRHTGFGTLTIEGLTIANGKYVSDNTPFGGCIYSKGSVTLQNSRVDRCVAMGTAATGARGGGVFAKGTLTLSRSSITFSSVYNLDAVAASGGGAFVVDNLLADYSTLSGDFASGYGGAASVGGDTISIESSTISSNLSDSDAGFYFSNVNGTAEITNSTISGNEAMGSGGALYARGNLKLHNSTVVFNHDHDSYSGVSVGGATFVVDSSIVAGNGNGLGPADLWAYPTTVVSGSKNLIVAATNISTLPDTITTCPKLDPLFDNSNGLSTPTHALKPGSPAIDAGSSPPTLLFDQTGYYRVVGPATDIGAFEWRTGTGTDRILVGGFDGLCDQ